MADEQIPRQDPAGAKFATRSYRGAEETFFDLSAEVIDQDVPYTLTADTDLAYLSVVNYDEDTGAITLATAATGANAVLAQPLKGLTGATGRVAIHTSGHFNTRALIYDASFNTDDLKQKAFMDSGRPMLRASTPKYSSDVINIPN